MIDGSRHQSVQLGGHRRDWPCWSRRVLRLARSCHDDPAGPTENETASGGLSVKSPDLSDEPYDIFRRAADELDDGIQPDRRPQLLAPGIYVEVHFLIDIRVIPEPDEAVPAEAAFGLEEGEPWWRRGVKRPEGALLDLLEIRVRHGIGHDVIIMASMLQRAWAVPGDEYVGRPVQRQV